ncbi:hypothetical protein GGR58DRAFT_470501 [Xylaria digitata]|nr:hypothetical protein GGR58DRAFT_470501 [Xylaria digitata]
MTSSKTLGKDNIARDKFLKRQAEAQGLGAPNAPSHKQGHPPDEAPVVLDSGITGAGVEGSGTNVPGGKGIGGASLCAGNWTVVRIVWLD